MIAQKKHREVTKIGYSNFRGDLCFLYWITVKDVNLTKQVKEKYKIVIIWKNLRTLNFTSI